jgi:phage tail sheath gpL-like
MPVSSAVELSAVAKVVGIKTTFKDLRAGSVLFLPQRVAVIGQGSSAVIYSTDKAEYTSALSVAETYGFGSPLHLAALQLLPANGDGIGSIPMTVYPLEDDASGAASVGDITPSGAATGSASFRVKVNNIKSEQFTVSNGDTVATIVTAIAQAISGSLNMPVVASDNTTDVGITAKWKGSSSNDLFIELEATSDDNSGISFAITQPSGGLVNPDVQPALGQVGDVWETMVLNCLDIADTTALDAYNIFGEGRWGALTKKPLVVFTGNTAATVANATVISDARKSDRVNSQLVSPGSNDLPLMVAARQLARIVAVANRNPARDYGSQDATGLTPGADGEQWLYTDRDSAVKKGSSTIEVKDGVVNVSDVVTFYHPDGDPNPAYRYVVDIVKLQNIIFNIDLIFAGKDWDGAPLIPDDQPTVNRDAKKPKAAVAAVCSMLDSLALNALISEPDTAKDNTFAEIDSTNPKRLNVRTTIQLSGNTNIISIDLDWGFFFGTTQIAA